MTRHGVRVAALASLLLISSCLDGDRAVTGEVNGIRVDCHGMIGTLDAASCGSWGAELLPMHPDASEIMVTVEGSVASPICEATFFDATGHVSDTEAIPCLLGH